MDGCPRLWRCYALAVSELVLLAFNGELLRRCGDSITLDAGWDPNRGEVAPSDVSALFLRRYGSWLRSLHLGIEPPESGVIECSDTTAIDALQICRSPSLLTSQSQQISAGNGFQSFSQPISLGEIWLNISQSTRTPNRMSNGVLGLPSFRRSRDPRSGESCPHRPARIRHDRPIAPPPNRICLKLSTFTANGLLNGLERSALQRVLSRVLENYASPDPEIPEVTIFDFREANGLGCGPLREPLFNVRDGRHIGNVQGRRSPLRWQHHDLTLPRWLDTPPTSGATSADTFPVDKPHVMLGAWREVMMCASALTTSSACRPSLQEYTPKLYSKAVRDMVIAVLEDTGDGALQELACCQPIFELLLPEGLENEGTLRSRQYPHLKTILFLLSIPFQYDLT